MEVTEYTMKSARVVYDWILTQASEVKRRKEGNKEEILEQEQKNITASVEHATFVECPSTEAMQVWDRLKDYFVSILGR